MYMWQLPILHFALAVLAVCATWLVQYRTRNAGIVDIIWTLIVGAAGVLYAMLATGEPLMRLAVGLLGAAWALRLGGYLAMRNIGKPEDRRYAELREQWGAKANSSMLRFYLFQAVIAWCIGLSFLPVAYQKTMVAMPLFIAGVAISTVGIIGEALADHQLAKFKIEPANKGRVCDTGLWRYSRHPNYFFECLHWLGYPLLAIGAQGWWLSLIGAIAIPVLLLKISGVPTIEQHAASSKREGYDDYVRRTSTFIPLPPRKD